MSESRAKIQTCDLRVCHYLNLKHGDLDHSATTAGFENKIKPTNLNNKHLKIKTPNLAHINGQRIYCTCSLIQFNFKSNAFIPKILKSLETLIMKIEISYRNKSHIGMATLLQHANC